MRNIISNLLLRHSGKLFASATLTFTASTFYLTPPSTAQNVVVNTKPTTQRQVRVVANKPQTSSKPALLPHLPGEIETKPTTPGASTTDNTATNKPATKLIAAPRRTADKKLIAQKKDALQKSKERWIEVILSEQRLVAWEGDKQVYAIKVSTGKRSTPTLTGLFAVKTKHRLTRMRGEDYDVPNVPYTMFYDGGYAIHGAYWHNRFGTPVSHGCTNLAVNHAKWLFNWADVGTAIVVRN